MSKQKTFRELNVSSISAIAQAASNNDKTIADQVVFVDPEECYAVNNPRKVFNQALIEQYAEEFIDDEQGQREAITLYPRDERGYRIHHGETRQRAGLLSKNKNPSFKLKAIIDPKLLKRSSFTNYFEMGKNNVARDNMNLLDIAFWMAESKNLAQQCGTKLTQNEIAKSLGKTPSWVSHVMNLVDLPDYLITVYNDGLTTDPWTLDYLLKLHKKNPDLCKKYVEAGSISRSDAKSVLDTGILSSERKTTQPSPGTDENQNTIQPSPGTGENQNIVQPSPGTGESQNTTQLSPGAGESQNTVQPSFGAGESQNTVQPSSGAGENQNTVQPSSGTDENQNTTQLSPGTSENQKSTPPVVENFDIVHAQKKEITLLQNGGAYIYWMEISGGKWISTAESTFEHGINVNAKLTNEHEYASEKSAIKAAYKILEDLVQTINNENSLSKEDLKTAEFLKLAIDLELEKNKKSKTQKGNKSVYLTGVFENETFVVLLKEPDEEGMLCIAYPDDLQTVFEVPLVDFKLSGYTSIEE
ncbi:ParB/RepB/Spo0J family partition protein [Pectobacterium versatile]|uniref:ParB/RepB/Spo0J family partition protein n=1 Tax=Pectobacterium versatile TaxID=2488639 RepID=UPI001F2149DC|nr:KorB domain-containing protein [Pectobacterium versatile]